MTIFSATDLNRLVSVHGISWNLDCFLCAVVPTRCCRCGLPGSCCPIAGPKGRHAAVPIPDGMANKRSSLRGRRVGVAVFRSGESLSEIAILRQLRGRIWYTAHPEGINRRLKRMREVGRACHCTSNIRVLSRFREFLHSPVIPTGDPDLRILVNANVTE
jgi:hypothetical protein